MSTAEIGDRVGLKTGTASRNVYYWAEGHPDMRGGHEMVSVRISPDDRRRRDLSLTVKGRAFLNQLFGV